MLTLRLNCFHLYTAWHCWRCWRRLRPPLPLFWPPGPPLATDATVTLLGSRRPTHPGNSPNTRQLKPKYLQKYLQSIYRRLGIVQRAPGLRLRLRPCSRLRPETSQKLYYEVTDRSWSIYFDKLTAKIFLTSQNILIQCRYFSDKLIQIVDKHYKNIFLQIFEAKYRWSFKVATLS